MEGARSPWHERQWLETHARIVAAADSLRRTKLRPLKVKDIAEAAKVSPRTVLRHFPNPDDALLVSGSEEGAHRTVKAILRRPADEPSVTAMFRAATEEAAVGFGMPDDLRRIGQGLVDIPEFWLVAQDGYVRNWQPLLLEALAARAGRTEPTREDRVAVTVAISLGLKAIQVWTAEGFTRGLDEVLAEFAAYLGVPPDETPASALDDTSCKSPTGND